MIDVRWKNKRTIWIKSQAVIEIEKQDLFNKTWWKKNLNLSSNVNFMIILQ